MTNPEMRLVLPRNRIKERVHTLAQDISTAFTGRDLVLVGVLNGVFMFMAELAKQLTIPARVDFIRLASYGQGSETSGRVEMTKDVETDLKGKHVLIVEDIADTGLTLKWLRDHMLGLGADSVATCVLINKTERRDHTLHLEYVGFEVEEGFLVGYGLDYNGMYRCLPEIYHLVME